MPESKSRKKKTSPSPEPERRVAKIETNPRWLVPTMLSLMGLGLAWVVTRYVTASVGSYPIPGLDNWNLLIGFVLIIAGFVLMTRWR